MGLFIGVDLGGTKIAACILDKTAERVIGHKTIETQAKNGPDAVLARIADLCQDLCAQENLNLEQIEAIGLGVPSIIDMEAGLTLLMPNLPGDWYRKPVTEILGTRTGRPCYLINDARAFTLAEATLGAGRGAHTVACFTLGTGIGGGIAIGGRLHLGVSGSAGEIGHLSIDYNGLPDNSGTPGGLESYASGPAITAMGVKAILTGATTNIGALVDYDLNRITPYTIRQAAEEGDAVAQNILRQAGFYIGVGIGAVITVVAPDRIIIGGGVANLGDWIMDPLRETVWSRCFTVTPDDVTIVRAQLGEDAGAIGAAWWAAQRLIPGD